MKTSLSTRRPAGFSLIEMMIATAVSGVLASVAYPSFSSALQKVRRTEALASLMQLQLAQERWRSASSRYGTLAEVGVAGLSAGRHYEIRVDTASSTGYEALAVATGGQARDRACRYLRLSVDAGNLSYRSGDTDATANSAQENRQCWAL